MPLNPEEKKRRASEAAKRWRKRNPERTKEIQRAYRKSPDGRRRKIAAIFKRKYGITLDERDRILAAQGGLCACCGVNEPSAYGWQTDHDHQTGAIRGTIEGVQKALDYLKRAVRPCSGSCEAASKKGGF